MPIGNINKRDMARYRNRDPQSPLAIKDRQLREYAERTGGVTLQFHQLVMGILWDKPHIMTSDEAAERLGLSKSDVNKIVKETAEGCGWPPDDGPA
jgi:DNA-binding MarR family transcriptional regulator